MNKIGVVDLSGTGAAVTALRAREHNQSEESQDVFMDQTTDLERAGLAPDGAGMALWAWLLTQTDDIDGCRPLALEACILAQRLSEVRAKLATSGLLISGPRGRSVKNPLIDTELRLAQQFVRTWRALGLSDAPPSDEPRRGPGRPPDCDRGLG